MNQTLQCPNCGSEIVFNAQQLIAGVTFECKNCKSQIRMSPSTMSETKKVYDKFVNLKNKISKQ